MAELNEFGRYFLDLNRNVQELEDKVRRNTETANGIRKLLSRTILSEKERLAKGELTKDKRLDAAICLSFGGAFDKWLEGSEIIYKKMREEEARLKEWSGGFFLYNATPQLSGPYCGEFFLGVVDNPEMSISFDKDIRFNKRQNPGYELGHAPSISIKTYNHLRQFNSATGHLEDMTPKA